jgi:hypothetical protein
VTLEGYFCLSPDIPVLLACEGLIAAVAVFLFIAACYGICELVN